jgi:MinD superfamily P-loop ATPase
MTHKINVKCTLCQDCVSTCPTGSIFLGRGQYVIDSDTCEDCGVCFSVCAAQAIEKPKPKRVKVEDENAQGS